MAEQLFWETCWREEDPEELFAYLKGYEHLALPEVELFRRRGVRTVCDAACGFGAYTLAFASQGFAVSAFDISPSAVRLAAAGLDRLGYRDIPFKTASLLETGYEDGAFDAAVAHSVLDHMTEADARKALAELDRITRAGGPILVSFDTAEDDDYELEHTELPDGSFLYTGDSHRAGMIFRPYDAARIDSLLAGRERLLSYVNKKGEQTVVLSAR